MIIGGEHFLAKRRHPQETFRVVVELNRRKFNDQIEPLPINIGSSIQTHASLRAALRAIRLKCGDVRTQQANKLGAIIEEKLRFPNAGGLHAIHLPAPRREKAGGGAGGGTVGAHFPAPRNLRGGEVKDGGQVVRPVTLAGLGVSIERKQLKFHQGEKYGFARIRKEKNEAGRKKVLVKLFLVNGRVLHFFYNRARPGANCKKFVKNSAKSISR